MSACLHLTLIHPLLDVDRPALGGGHVPDAVLHAAALAAKERGRGREGRAGLGGDKYISLFVYMNSLKCLYVHVLGRLGLG